MEHIPVLADEVLNYLNLKAGEVVVDGTLGLGGHALLVSKKIGKRGKLIAFEQDERNLVEAKKRLNKYKDQITYISDNFRYLKNRLAKIGVHKVDAILLDLGLSSPHIDDESRGFSFMREGPLDMRFDKRGKLTADDVVNTYTEEHLAEIFRNYGEEILARKMARKICEARKNVPFRTTKDLGDFIQENFGNRPPYRKKIHPATKIFQAIRIEVNDELNALKEVLEAAAEVLKIGGRIVIMSYHSGEDRIVKQFFAELEKPKAFGEEAIYTNFSDPFFVRITRKAVQPSDEEVERNVRARSAKLRAYKKVRELEKK